MGFSLIGTEANYPDVSFPGSESLKVRAALPMMCPVGRRCWAPLLVSRGRSRSVAQGLLGAITQFQAQTPGRTLREAAWASSFLRGNVLVVGPVSQRTEQRPGSVPCQFGCSGFCRCHSRCARHQVCSRKVRPAAAAARPPSSRLPLPGLSCSPGPHLARALLAPFVRFSR